MKDELVVYDKPKSSLSENIRTIRTNLEFTAINGGLKTVLITSSISGEGKSFIASNLAVAFAQAGKKTLLIDCDIRKGRLHKIFDLDDNVKYKFSIKTNFIPKSRIVLALIEL